MAMGLEEQVQYWKEKFERLQQKNEANNAERVSKK